jgi:hypothetical protein
MRHRQTATNVVKCDEMGAYVRMTAQSVVPDDPKFAGKEAAVLERPVT